MSEPQQADLEARLIAKAWRDDAFRQALISDPKRTIEKELGREIPEGVQFQVHEQTATIRHVVLPQKPEGELSESELEHVAGGWRKYCDMASTPLAFQSTDALKPPFGGQDLGE